MSESFPSSGAGALSRLRDLETSLNNMVSVIDAAPVAGTDSIHTLTIGGTPTGGSLRFSYGGTTVTAAWSSTNATLLSNINTALDALFPGNAVNAAAGSLTAGIGTILITHSNTVWGKRPIRNFEVTSALTGTSPTATMTNSTPGVRPTGYGVPTGGLILSTDDAVVRVNTGTPTAPVLTALAPEA